MTIRSRSAPAPGLSRARGGVLLAMLALLAGCAADTAPPRAAAPSGDPRALAADLDALQRQSEPASDDVIASLERTLREQREKRARAVVAAGTTAVIPPSPAAPAALTTPPAAPPAVVAAPAPVPVPVAAASAPSKPVHLTKAQARAASAAAARQAAVARQSAPVVAPAPEGEPAAIAAALPPPAPPLPSTAYTSAATVVGPPRTPMSRLPESHMPVDELYARARELELQLQVPAAIGLYREASQRGHAPSSQRLMELYADGAPGVARDYRVAVFFKERAVQQGASFDPVWRR
jgi:hypothetical protein